MVCEDVGNYHRPTLLIICGLSFAGKSTLGRALSRKFGLAEVDVDETKVRLHGPEISDEQLTQKQWDAIYAETDKEIATCLKSGQSVVDASRHFKKAERDKTRLLAKDLHADFITIYVDTPESVVRERWLQNRKTQARRDIADADFQKIVAVMQPPTAEECPIVFHFADDIERWMSALSIAGTLRLKHKPVNGPSAT
jgi:predicted kinase